MSLLEQFLLSFKTCKKKPQTRKRKKNHTCCQRSNGRKSVQRAIHTTNKCFYTKYDLLFSTSLGSANYPAPKLSERKESRRVGGRVPEDIKKRASHTKISPPHATPNSSLSWRRKKKAFCLNTMGFRGAAGSKKSKIHELGRGYRSNARFALLFSDFRSIAVSPGNAHPSVPLICSPQ